MTDLPETYQTGDPQKYDPNSAWWQFNLVGNWSRLNFQRMTQVDIIPAQQARERKAYEGMIAMDKVIKGKTAAQAQELITKFSTITANKTVTEWRDLAYTLMAKYSDGYINIPGKPANPIGYPAQWLNETQYYNGPTTYDMK